MSEVLNLPQLTSSSQRLEDTIAPILSAIGQELECDRVFLYLRSPRLRVGRVPFCWRHDDSIPLVYDPDWKPEPASLASNDPMFAAALAGQPSIYVEDVETASPKTLNYDFEREHFGHRSLIHGHLCVDQTLWGVLQPCVFTHPRHWDSGDRHLMEEAIAWATPLAVEYVNRHLHQ